MNPDNIFSPHRISLFQKYIESFFYFFPTHLEKDHIASGCFCNSLYNLSKNRGKVSAVQFKGSWIRFCAVLNILKTSHKNSLLSGSLLPIINNLY